MFSRLWQSNPRPEADRLTGQFNLLTTGEVARILEARLSNDTGRGPRITGADVRGWIEAGELEAVDLRRKGAKRPRWYTSAEWVERFLRTRMTPKGDTYGRSASSA